MWVMYVTLCHMCTPTWQLCMYHSAIKQRESVSHGQRPRQHAGPVVPLGISKGPRYVKLGSHFCDLALRLSATRKFSKSWPSRHRNLAIV